VFERLCRESDASGDLAADAYLAALAVEGGADLISLDRDFARFAALRWRKPG
jgi:predicted nucleic acid-binding protein